MPKFTLHIHNLSFETIVGILKHEREVAQKVLLEATIEYRREGKQFINYAEVVALLESEMKGQKYLLLEEALEDLTEQLKSKYSTILAIRLKILKPDILDDCEVGVEIFKIY